MMAGKKLIEWFTSLGKQTLKSGVTLAVFLM